MLPYSRRVALIVPVLLALTLTACEQGFKLGNSWLIKPKHPLVATSFQVTRRHSPPGLPTSAPRFDVNEKLVVDLTNGRSAFTDTDGRVFPGQLPPDQTEQLRTLIANREWQIGKRSALPKTADVVNYGLTVYNGDKPIKEQAFWAEPPAKPLPPAIKQLETAIDQAQRLAHPLSGTVDLLK